MHRCGFHSHTLVLSYSDVPDHTKMPNKAYMNIHNLIPKWVRTGLYDRLLKQKFFCIKLVVFLNYSVVIMSMSKCLQLQNSTDLLTYKLNSPNSKHAVYELRMEEII